MQFGKRLGFVLLLLAAVGLFFAFDLGQYLNLATIKSRQAELDNWRAGQPLGAALMFFAAYVAVTALSLPGAAIMTLAAGAVFGLGWGMLIVSFAASVGATLAFLTSRWLLGSWVQQRFGDRLAALNAGVAKEGGFYLFTLRLVPVLPFFVINLAMGLTPIRPLTFYWVSQLGMLAGTFVYVNAGTQLARIDSLAGIVSPGLLGSLVLLGIFPLIAKKLIDGVKARKIYARWKKPASFDRNLIVIGGGSAGLVTAYIASAIKAKVTLVEKHKLGGDCLHTGCVPSKALIRSAKFLSHVQRAPEFGIKSASADFDFAEVMERVQRVITAIEPHDSVERYTGLGVDVAEGTARIVSPWEVEITHADGSKKVLTTRSIVIAAGARPFVPPIPGIELVEVLTSDNVWNLRQRPERLLVLGGGPIGSEMAQAFARLGCKVSQVEMGPRLLSREDPEVSELVAQRFRAEGIDVLVGHEAKRVEVDGEEKWLVVEHEGLGGLAGACAAHNANLLAVGNLEVDSGERQVGGGAVTHLDILELDGAIGGPALDRVVFLGLVGVDHDGLESLPLDLGLELGASVVDVVLSVNGRVVCQPGDLLHSGRQRDGLRDQAESPGVEHQQLDGVGEGKADVGSPTVALGHRKHAHSHKHDCAVEVAVEGDPQVEGVGIEEGSVMLVSLASELLQQADPSNVIPGIWNACTRGETWQCAGHTAQVAGTQIPTAKTAAASLTP